MRNDLPFAKSLGIPFRPATDGFPTGLILAAFEAGIWRLRLVAQELSNQTIQELPDTSRLDEIAAKYWEDRKSLYRHNPAFPHEKPPEGGSSGYRCDQVAVLADLNAALDEHESTCRATLTKLAAKLAVSQIDDPLLSEASRQLEQFRHAGETRLAVLLGRKPGHIQAATPLGKLLQQIDLAQKCFEGAINFVKAANMVSSTIAELEQSGLIGTELAPPEQPPWRDCRAC
jgi:hypothetical protein